MITEQSQELCYRDCDLYKRLRPSALLAFFSQLAGEQLDSIGLPHQMLWDNGYVFVLVKIAVHFDRVPNLGETVTVTTAPKGTKSLYFLRNFEVKDENGQSIVQATSYWVVVNPDSRSIVRPREFPFALPIMDSLDFVLPALKMPGDIAFEPAGEYNVMFSDLDYNGHMSNIRYADLALNLLPKEAPNRPIKTLQINYHHEISTGQTILLQKTDELFVRGTSKDQIIFDALIAF